MSEPTADELWAWLTACTTCGREHQFRQADPPSSGWTWAAPDGHGYDPRAPYALVRLRDTWNAFQARHPAPRRTP